MIFFLHRKWENALRVFQLFFEVLHLLVSQKKIIAIIASSQSLIPSHWEKPRPRYETP